MMSWVVLVCVLIIVVLVGTWAWGSIFGRGEALPELDDHHAVIETNAAAVRAGNIGAVQLEVAPRGYRQDQVDALIGELFQQLDVSRGTHPRA